VEEELLLQISKLITVMKKPQSKWKVATSKKTRKRNIIFKHVKDGLL